MSSLAEQYRHIDTTRPDGCYVHFDLEKVDDESGPCIYPSARQQLKYLLDHDEGMSIERATDYMHGEWNYVGVRAVARIAVVHGGTSTLYTLKSAGLWGIESDSDASYFQSVFDEEKAALIEDLKLFATFSEI